MRCVKHFLDDSVGDLIESRCLFGDSFRMAFSSCWVVMFTFSSTDSGYIAVLISLRLAGEGEGKNVAANCAAFSSFDVISLIVGM